MLSPDGLADIKHRLSSRYLDSEQMLTDLLHLVETVDQLTHERDAIAQTLGEECDKSTNARAEVWQEVENGLARQCRMALAGLDQLRDAAKAVTDCSFALADGDEAQREQHHVFRSALRNLRRAAEA